MALIKRVLIDNEISFEVVNIIEGQENVVDKFNKALSEGKIALYAGGYKNGT